MASTTLLCVAAAASAVRLVPARNPHPGLTRLQPARSAPRAPLPPLLADGGLDGTRQEGATSAASVSALKFYKSAISPLIPAACRFIPTCSEYGQLAFENYPPWQATILTSWRLLRCSPLHLKGNGYGDDLPVWPPPAYWTGSSRLRTYIDDEISRARANGEDVEPLAFGGSDPLGLADREENMSSPGDPRS